MYTYINTRKIEIWKHEALMEVVNFREYTNTLVNLYKNIAWDGAVTTLNCRLKKWYVCLKMGDSNEMGQGLRCEEESSLTKHKMIEYFHR